MKDTDFYHQVLGLNNDWQVTSVDLDMKAEKVMIDVEYTGKDRPDCPECGVPCGIYDHMKPRRWRHLDTCQLTTYICARVPRVQCAEHGVKTIGVPWAEPHGRFTLMFEAMVIQWLRACMNQSVVADRLRLSFDQVHRIMEQAVERGLSQREEYPMRQLGIDEKSMKRGHHYLSVLCDLENGCIHDVVEGRKTEDATALFATLTKLQKDTVECVNMDMWEPYMKAVREHLPQADIVHDRFHVSKHLNECVDKTRRAELKKLVAAGEDGLKRMRYHFLRNSESVNPDHLESFAAARKVAVKTTAAWLRKEVFRSFWDQKSREKARLFLARWYKDARQCNLPELNKKATMLIRHSAGLLSYFKHQTTNAIAENLNSKIQRLKAIGHGFRAFKNYRINILFHFGNLKLTPHKSP